jgi:hypothetical protein
MASKTTKVVSVRLRNEIAEWLEGRNLKEIVENLYEGQEVDGLLEISFLYNIDPQDLVCDIKDMLDNGELIIEDGKLKKRYVT